MIILIQVHSKGMSGWMQIKVTELQQLQNIENLVT